MFSKHKALKHILILSLNRGRVLNHTGSSESGAQGSLTGPQSCRALAGLFLQEGVW